MNTEYDEQPVPMTTMDQVIRSFADQYHLTKRESEIMNLMVVYGYSNKELASHCMISEKTVKNHIEKIRNKVGAGSTRKLLSSFIVHQFTA
ncbi:helix-turn-helix transcriptional regulator [Paenibacillus profundus]|uniref:Helix-turn-helix transcriptional regulator n=1 Tax=Paenibacillus profundus TaxID=1173085 RepID=A0ABS8YAT8_9BACL|nr:helix-turn-helix transcriptional regulator [Paenibacillus profundus]MCE5169068.1 helix-turn-helix transcriptional regulator [Paenibacillus profundus]